MQYSTTAIYIRNASPADAKPLSDLICENAENLLKSHYSEAQWDIFIKYYSEEVLREKINKQIVFVAEKEGAIVGTVALDGDIVVGFYTRYTQLKQGIGKLLMRHLENYARNNGISMLQLAASPEGLGYYYATGWIKIKDYTFNYLGVDFDETLMHKKLC